MLFHVTMEVYPTVFLDDDKRSREVVGPQLQNIMGSGKVREAGLLAGKRGLLPRGHRCSRGTLRAVRAGDLQPICGGGAPGCVRGEGWGDIPEVGCPGQVVPLGSASAGVLSRLGPSFCPYSPKCVE